MNTHRGILLAAASLGALSLACDSGGTSSNAEPPAVATIEQAVKPSDGHLLLVLETSPQGVRVVSSRRVPGEPPRSRGKAHGRFRVQVEGAGDEVLYETAVPATPELRAEWVDEQGELQGRQVTPERTAFVVRVPDLPGAARLRLRATDRQGQNPRDVGAVALPEVAR